MLLDVPYYKQIMLGSCGPACLLMVAAYYKKTPLNRLEEFHAWRKAGLWPFGMTESYGLARVAVDLGLVSLVVKQKPDFEIAFPTQYLRGKVFTAVKWVMRRNYHRLRASALRLGVREVHGEVNRELVERLVQNGIPPIVMVDQSRYAFDEDFRYGVLHWVVVKGVDGGITINDPDLGPNVKLTKEAFDDALNLSNFRTDSRIVAISNGHIPNFDIY